MKAFLVFLLKLGLTILCLWWSFAHVDFGRMDFGKAGAIDFAWLACGIALAGLSIVLHATRWWFFMNGQALGVSLRRAVELMMIDSLFSLASVSGLGGDAARVILLGRDHPGRKLVIATSVIADHLAGLVSMAVLFLVISAARFEMLAEPSLLGRGVIQFAWLYMGGGLALVALIFVCASPPVHRYIHHNGRFSRWPILERLPLLCDGYRKNWRHALAGLAVSFLMLLVYFSSYYCGMRAVGASPEYGAVISSMPVIDSISGLPVSVAGVGIRERLFQVLFHDLATMPPEKAVAGSLAGFACNALWALPGALFFLRKRDRIRVSEFDAEKEV